MVVVLIAWIALALVLGALIGKVIHRADAVEFPARVEDPWWVVTPPAAPREAAGPREAAAPREVAAPREADAPYAAALGPRALAA